MRLKHTMSRLHELRSSAQGAIALLFLHELSAECTLGQPPRGARWERIIAKPTEEWGQALEDACQACLAQWPEQLEGFFAEARLSEEQPQVLAAAVKAIEGACAKADGEGRQTILADVFQETRGLSAKQARGAFFTPWNLAAMMADTAGDAAQETWVGDLAVGGGALLLGYLERFRNRHGFLASRAVTLIGVDIDARSCQIARASLLLAGADPSQFWICHGDSLAQKIAGRDRRDGELKIINFDVLLGNPPFGQKVSMTALAERARRGPLVIPDHILNRVIPSESAQPAPDTAPAATSRPSSRSGKHSRRRAA
jgi:type I restriction-modification system DNA methylase subunit